MGKTWVRSRDAMDDDVVDLSHSRWKETWNIAVIIYAKGCDLVPKSYLCNMVNTLLSVKVLKRPIVNCFQNVPLQYGKTAHTGFVYANTKLWIAFKIVLLQYGKHRRPLLIISAKGCELLSKSYLCNTVNTCSKAAWSEVWLWIAFKIVPLQYGKHHDSLLNAVKDGCELLSKSYLCNTVNTTNSLQMISQQVVNCFQNRTFAIR